MFKYQNKENVITGRAMNKTKKIIPKEIAIIWVNVVESFS